MDEKSHQTQKEKAKEKPEKNFRNTFSYGMARSPKDKDNTIKGLILLCRFRKYTASNCSDCLRLLYGESKYCVSAGMVNSVFETLVQDPSLYARGKLDHSKILEWIDSRGVRGMVEKDLKALKFLQARRRQDRDKDDISDLSRQVRAVRMEHKRPPEVP